MNTETVSKPSSQDGLALAARCEAATGPDWKLDGDIKLAYAARLFADGATKDDAIRILDGDLYAHPLPYTASIDAAMTLVPEKHWWSVGQRCAETSPLRSFGSHTGIFCAQVGDWSSEWRAENDKPALALCAAALRAIAAKSSAVPDDR